MRQELISKTMWIIAEYDLDFHPFAEMFQNRKVMSEHGVELQIEDICRHLLLTKTSKMMAANGDADMEITTRLIDVHQTLSRAQDLTHSPLINAAGAYIMTLSALGSMGTGAWGKYVKLVDEYHDLANGTYVTALVS